MDRITNAANSSSCLLCFEVSYASLDNKFLTSRQCGHKICRKCLQKDTQSCIPRPVGILPNDSLDTTDKTLSPLYPGLAKATTNSSEIVCPLCQTVSSFNDWVDREGEDSVYDQEKSIRQRVLTVYNLNRENFESTPGYNDFLEKREDTIYHLTFSQDETERRRLQEEVETYELEHQKQIVECKQKQQQLDNDAIRDIVKKEGIFFEIVQQNYTQGFRTSYHPHLTHVLERAHPELFVPNLNDYSDNLFNKKNESFTGVIGIGHHPKPLDAGISYQKLPRIRCTDKAAMFRASGLSKDLIGNRVLQELWGGLQVNIYSTIKREK